MEADDGGDEDLPLSAPPTRDPEFVVEAKRLESMKKRPVQFAACPCCRAKVVMWVKVVVQ